MDIHLIAYYIGIAIIFGTHIYMLAIGTMTVHASLNVFAGVLIAYYFMNKERFIRF